MYLRDANAVSVVVPNPTELAKGDCVQLGFLPRAVAKWEALAAAFRGNGLKVQLTLHGPNFFRHAEDEDSEHVAAFCSLVASLRRCTGLWRMEEVLHQYNWPETMESDFIYGSSSIGTSVSAQFSSSIFSSCCKRSHLFDSEESDPEWGRWTTTDELKDPSMRIIFPTIDRVRSAQCGILPSKHLLCFSDKTWERLRSVNILHDAVPHPSERSGYPMHVKVARRRFKSKTDGASFGWIYCGSHNMSAAAWGRSISSQPANLVSGTSDDRSSRMRLHVCNYELGIIFVFPQPKSRVSSSDNSSTLDDIILPFVVPGPRYGPRDSQQLSEGRVSDLAAVEETVEDVPDEDDEVEVLNCVVHEEDDEKAYADALWHQVDSSRAVEIGPT
ncbi:Tyrosyl-DNA phosphodiesterase 1 [Bienertia sinuspersici]